jgi:hypothetical protein
VFFFATLNNFFWFRPWRSDATDMVFCVFGIVEFGGISVLHNPSTKKANFNQK